MKKFCYALTSLIALLFLVVHAPQALAQSDTSTNGFKIEFLGSTDNGDGTQTWEYRVTETPTASNGLSHWVLPLCFDDLNSKVLSWTPKAGDEGVTAVSRGTEGTQGGRTGLTGIKWDLEEEFGDCDNDLNNDCNDAEDDSAIFTITVDGVYDETTVGPGFKAGPGSGFATVPGINCASGECQTAEVISRTPMDGQLEVTFEALDGIDAVTENPNSINAEVYAVEGADGTSFSDDNNDGTWTPPAGTSPFPTKVTVTFKPTDPNRRDARWMVTVSSPCGEVNFDPPVEYELTAPEAFDLSGNYPNPFAGQTVIEVALPEAASVTLAVYDVMGRRVATVMDRKMSAGAHQISWNGRSDSGQRLASGTYFYRIEAGSYVATRKLTIVR